jgi:outer membrane translocation and assembly module TamA
MLAPVRSGRQYDGRVRPSLPNVLAFAALLACGAGCAQTRPTKLPGETDLRVDRVTITARDGRGGAEARADDDVDMGPLLPKLGSRPGNALYTDRFYNPLRVAEDRRRVLTYLQSLGYFEAEVDEPRVRVDEPGAKVDLTITYVAGPRYALRDVRFVGAPARTEGALRGLVPARPGERWDLEAIRVARYEMAAALQREGFGHARVLVRTYVDRDAKSVTVVYFADPGPRTRVGTVRVEGNRKVTTQDIEGRLGLRRGDPFSLTAKEKAELDLLDTGAFAGAVLETTADVETYLGDVPDSGGVVPDERVAEDGTLLPRKLPDTVDLIVHVDEAPRARVRLRATVEADPTRGDATAGAELDLRNALGSQHHLLLRGRAGYGVLWSDDEGTPKGLYGDALARYTRPSALGRLGDGRISVRFRDVLYPGAHLRELFAGPGLRATLARGLFIEGDAGFRLARQVDFGPFDDAVRTNLALSRRDDARGLEVSGALVQDERNDPVEPTRGHLLALRTSVSPGGALATHRWVLVAPEARAYVGISSSFSLALRASGGWTFGWDDAGVPLGPRFFGGGAFGMRGVGRDRLSPVALGGCASGTSAPAQGGAVDPTCRAEVVGGLSLVESTVELRYLPPLKQAGLAIFVDAGGAGRRGNPFASGVSMAAGLGPRLRLWYVPLSVDMAIQIAKEGAVDDHRLLVFARIGEAF